MAGGSLTSPQTMTRAPVSVSSRRVRCACIDIGSNTTRLLVAEAAEDGRLREVLALREFTRVRTGLSADVIVHGVATGGEQLAAARSVGAEDVCVVGTAAIRAAPDGAVLCDA